MMARFRPIVKSDKHEVTWSNLSQDAATAVVTVGLATGVAPADRNSSTEIGQGNRVTSIYFEFNISAAQTGNVNVFHWEIVLMPNNLTPPAPNLYYQPGKNLIIKRGMEMLPTNVATVFKRIFVVRIPKKGQRVGLGDKIQFRYQSSSTQTINCCGIAIYKEWQ